MVLQFDFELLALVIQVSVLRHYGLGLVLEERIVQDLVWSCVMQFGVRVGVTKLGSLTAPPLRK